MLHEDLNALIGRLDRIGSAIGLGCDSAIGGVRPEVADALVETCWESVRLGHELIMRVAYDDLWNGLPLLQALWERLEVQAQRVRLVDVRAISVVGLSRTVSDGLAAVSRAVEELDAAQLIATARPRDRQATARAAAAIGDLEAAGDRFFVTALLDEGYGRIDGALAMLTTVAARAARERTASGARNH